MRADVATCHDSVSGRSWQGALCDFIHLVYHRAIAVFSMGLLAATGRIWKKEM
ncbi:hypothetical protein DT23_05030 [Thioclava indica]|uniref:Uncharacterized protein n=1 Tax=Thioclava indica TaxID=1353528 RepID=A0A074JNB7_9RHOB|nr:hypothetical protein DT23_05030 [Thioclava indica]